MRTRAWRCAGVAALALLVLLVRAPGADAEGMAMDLTSQIDEQMKRVAPLDDARRAHLVELVTSDDDRFRMVVDGAFAMAWQAGQRWDATKGFHAGSGGDLRAAASAWRATLPLTLREFDKGGIQDARARRALLDDTLPGLTGRDAMDRVLVQACVLSGVTLDEQAEIAGIGPALAEAERDAWIFGQDAAPAAAHASREAAEQALAEDPAAALAILAGPGPDEMRAAAARALCDLLVPKGRVPDATQGWVKAPDATRDPAQDMIVMAVLSKGDVAHPLIAQLARGVPSGRLATIVRDALTAAGGSLEAAEGHLRAHFPGQ